MAVTVSAFDQWQKDAFFPAAEVVQESADIMESLYRAWLRDRCEGFKPGISDELRRDLQTALGTAKWQLEEFERATRASHASCSSQDHSITRHMQFVVAIEGQIFRVEKSLEDSFIEEGKQPFQWVHLDEEEQNDLAAFLSASPQPMRGTAGNFKQSVVDTVKAGGELDHIRGSSETATTSNNFNYMGEQEAKELFQAKKEASGQRETMNERTWSSPDIGAWKIEITHEDTDRKSPETKTEPPSRSFNFRGLASNVECMEKSKWSRSSFHKEKSEEHIHFKRGISSYLNLKGFYRRAGGLKLRLWGSQYSVSLSGSARITFLLVLTLFLIVPFVFYSN